MQAPPSLTHTASIWCVRWVGMARNSSGGAVVGIVGVGVGPDKKKMGAEPHAWVCALAALVRSAACKS
jgi:hypothetical protein